MDLEYYYRPDHPGHQRLEEIRDYSKAHQQLTIAERQYCVDYFEQGREHVDNHTLHTLANSPYTGLNFRGGWSAVLGTQGEILTTVIWNHNVVGTKFRIPLDQTKEEQIRGQDLIATNPEWRETYNIQVKQLKYGSYDDLKIDETELCSYDPDFVHRLVLVDIKNLLIYHFDYREFLDYYKKNRVLGGYLNNDLGQMKSEMKHFVSLTL